MRIPSTVGRVPNQTAEHVNRQIRLQTERDIIRVASEGPASIARRLSELDREWDIERLLEANAATVMLAGITLGVTVDRRFLAVPALVAGFLLQHAIHGWCPPLPVFRRMGIRTSSEIEYERHALLAMRGDRG